MSRCMQAPSPDINVGLLLTLADSYMQSLLRKKHTPLDLTNQQLDVLLCLYKGKTYARELTNELNINSYNISKIIQRLVKRGLIIRKTCLTDKRRTVLVLSHKGHSICEMNNNNLLQNVLKTLTNRISQNEIEMLEELLKKLIPNATLNLYR